MKQAFAPKSLFTLLIFTTLLILASCSSTITTSNETKEQNVVVSEKNQIGQNFKLNRNLRY